jgi:hypothetical protein
MLRDDSLPWFPSINGCPVKEGASDSMSLRLYFVLSRPVLFGTLLKRMIDSNQYLQTQNENEAGKVRCEMRTDTDNDI